MTDLLARDVGVQEESFQKCVSALGATEVIDLLKDKGVFAEGDISSWLLFNSKSVKSEVSKEEDSAKMFLVIPCKENDGFIDLLIITGNHLDHWRYVSTCVPFSWGTLEPWVMDDSKGVDVYSEQALQIIGNSNKDEIMEACRLFHCDTYTDDISTVL